MRLFLYLEKYPNLPSLIIWVKTQNQKFLQFFQPIGMVGRVESSGGILIASGMLSFYVW